MTRQQLRDIPDVDALYFTMLNSNKRSLAINANSSEGKGAMEKLIGTPMCWRRIFASGADGDRHRGCPGNTSTSSICG